jgi:predicted nucleotidyltransferase component of viral defense system
MSEQIKLLVESWKAKGLRNDFIINRLKEHLQLNVLNFLYNHKKYSEKLIFTGGTCLRFCFELPRLSEDLDFDYESNLDIEKLAMDLEFFFKSSMLIKEADVAIKGKNKKIYIRLPILKDVLITFEGAYILYLKVEANYIKKIPRAIETSPISKDGMYFFIRRYSIADLMSGKINAFLTRTFFKGRNNEIEFKGRDVFDIIWYMGQNIKPNFERLRTLLQNTKYKHLNWKEILDELKEKLKNIKKEHLKIDVLPFIENSEMLDQFFKNYLQVFEQYYQNQMHV